MESETTTRVPEKARRLDQLLASCGYCSRREARAWLRRGGVTVDGVVERAPDRRVFPSAVRVEGEPVDHPDGIVVVLHKTAGTVCTHDEGEGETVFARLPERWRHRHPPLVAAGRLDKDATGLLVLTDHGDLVHAWTSPRRHVAKEYVVLLDRDVRQEWVAAFAGGLSIGDDRPCLPARLEGVGNRHARVELHEGRHHQVKRMFAVVGAMVLGLHRVRFGPFTLEGLEPGSWRVATWDGSTPMAAVPGDR
jgi:16S rRNA pseudouridine516 synthase